jgi:hypothetical protein
MARFRLSHAGFSRNLGMLALVVSAIVGFGGVAFACGGGGGGGGCDGGFNDGHGGDCQKNPDLVWTTPTSAVPSHSPVTCTLGRTTSTLTVVVTHLAPGQNCTFSAHLENVGEVPAKVNEAVSISHPSNCALFQYSDNLPSSPELALEADHYYAYSGKIALSGSAGNACQGAAATIVVTLTGTATTCDAAPVSGPVPVESIALWKCW